MSNMHLIIIESSKGLLSLQSFEERKGETYVYILVGEVGALKADLLEDRNLIRLSDTSKAGITNFCQHLLVTYDLKDGLDVYTTDQTFNVSSANIISGLKDLTPNLYLLDHLKTDNLEVEAKFNLRTYVRFASIFMTHVTKFRSVKFSNNALGYMILIPGISIISLPKSVPRTSVKIDASIIILLPLSFDQDITLISFLNYLEAAVSDPSFNICSVALKFHPRERINAEHYFRAYPNLKRCEVLDKNIPFELYSFEQPLIVNLNSSFSNHYNLPVASLYPFFVANMKLLDSNVTGTPVKDLQAFKSELIKKSRDGKKYGDK